MSGPICPSILSIQLGASFSHFQVDFFSHCMPISGLNFSLSLHILRVNFPLPTLADPVCVAGSRAAAHRGTWWRVPVPTRVPARLLKGSLTLVVERQPGGLLEGPARFADAPGGLRRRPDLQKHGEVVAAQVSADTPGAPLREGRAAEGDIRDCLAAGSVAREGRATVVEDQPAAAVKPCRDPVADLVSLLAVGVPQRLMGVDVTGDDGVVSVGKGVRIECSTLSSTSTERMGWR